MMMMTIHYNVCTISSSTFSQNWPIKVDPDWCTVNYVEAVQVCTCEYKVFIGYHCITVYTEQVDSLTQW